MLLAEFKVVCKCWCEHLCLYSSVAHTLFITTSYKDKQNINVPLSDLILTFLCLHLNLSLVYVHRYTYKPPAWSVCRTHIVYTCCALLLLRNFPP